MSELLITLICILEGYAPRRSSQWLRLLMLIYSFGTGSQGRGEKGGICHTREMGQSRSPTLPHPSRDSLKRPSAERLNSKCNLSERVSGSPGGQAGLEEKGNWRGQFAADAGGDHRPFTAMQRSAPGRSAPQSPSAPAAATPTGGRRAVPSSPPGKGTRGSAGPQQGTQGLCITGGAAGEASSGSRRAARLGSLGPERKVPPPPPLTRERPVQWETLPASLGLLRARLSRAGGRLVACAAARTSPHGHTRAGAGRRSRGDPCPRPPRSRPYYPHRARLHPHSPVPPRAPHPCWP